MIKKIILSQLFWFIVQLNLTGQNWLPIGTEWHYETTLFGQPISDNIYTITGNTNINGNICSVLTKTYASCDLRPSKEYFYKENDKLFYYDSNSDQFLLYFDFSAQVGEILKIPTYSEMRDMEDIDTTYIRIDSVSYLNLNGLELKFFNISDGRKNNNGDILFNQVGIDTFHIIIEDIGRIGSFFNYLEDGICDKAYSYPLRHFIIPGYGTYNIDELSGIETKQYEMNTFIFPNPANDFLTISNLSQDINSVSLIDGKGRICKTIGKDKMDLGEVHIDISKFDTGLYFIILLGKNLKHIKTSKIFKI